MKATTYTLEITVTADEGGDITKFKEGIEDSIETLADCCIGFDIIAYDTEVTTERTHEMQHIANYFKSHTGVTDLTEP